MLDCSYGTIPYHIDNGTVSFLLMIDARSGHWTYPKGHAISTETPLETALRELKEEASLVPNAILEHEPLIQEYSFVHNHKTIDRRIQFFIVRIDNQKIILQTDEIQGYKWMTCEEVIMRTPFPELHGNTQRALKIIESQTI